MANAGEQFSRSLSNYGSSPPPAERYLQETHLFNFFSSGFSIFEAYFYGLFSIGHFLEPASFPIETPRDQQAISPTRTRDAYVRSGLSPSLVSSFDSLFADAEYAELKIVRNILSHRAAPGRTMFVSIGSDVLQSAEWKINNIRLDADMTDIRRNAMSRLLKGLLIDCDELPKTKIAGKP